MSSTAAIVGPATRQRAAARLNQSLVWCAALVLVLALRGYLADPAQLTTTFGDPDDAVRLYQVRSWLAGAGWFDLTLPRLGGADPLLSHWSRLIDVPVGLLARLFSSVLTTDGAELAARVIWPTLLLVALVSLVAREVERTAGRTAFWLALALVATTPLAVVQFQIGRIDHHNAMILAAAGGLILLLKSVDDVRAGPAAGILIGIGLSIGLEAIGLIATAVAAAVLVAEANPAARPGVRLATTWLAITVVAGLLISVPPARWLDIRCDALSLNLVMLVVAGAMGVAAVDRWAPRTGRIGRLVMLAGAGGMGVMLYALAEPRCLAGPFGMVDPAVRPIWLDGVREGYDIWRFAAVQTGMALGYAVMMVAAVAFAVLAVRRRQTPRSILQLCIVILAAAYGCIYVKLMPYALWVAILVIAVEAAQLPAMLGQPARTIKLGTVILFNQSTVTALATLLVPVMTAGAAVPSGFAPAQSAGCNHRAGIRTLAALPTGLFVADIDLGALIVADTPHRALAAPYHRLDRQIIAAHEILSGPAAGARAGLASVGAQYVAICATPAGDRDNSSLRGAMTNGAPIAGLHRVALPATVGGLVVYRMTTQ
ncbi:MAG: hypothetical protein R3D27_06865 [Hyphomicrobiaceae bacterium]